MRLTFSGMAAISYLHQGGPMTEAKVVGWLLTWNDRAIVLEASRSSTLAEVDQTRHGRLFHIQRHRNSILSSSSFEVP